jgi:prepilin-type processing-associated H-X9-DG protein
VIMPFLEQGNLFNTWNLQVDSNSNLMNSTARFAQVSSYLCPSDASTGIQVDPGLTGFPCAKNNYFASTGNTAAQNMAGGGTTLQETNSAFLGLFHVRFDSSQPQYLDAPTNSQKNPGYQAVLGTALAEITDGTSNTAMYSEIKRSRFTGLPALDPTNTIDPVQLASGTFTLQVPPAGCAVINNRLTYRGNQYYRFIPQTTNYSHTIPPNSTLVDCGDSGVVSGHTAARSYHPGGVNSCFADGSVKFVKSTINLTTWRALGSRAGGEVISADAY